MQKWNKFLAHLSKVAFGYEKKKKSCKNPVALFLRLPRAGCHHCSGGKFENFETFQNIVKLPLIWKVLLCWLRKSTWFGQKTLWQKVILKNWRNFKDFAKNANFRQFSCEYFLSECFLTKPNLGFLQIFAIF